MARSRVLTCMPHSFPPGTLEISFRLCLRREWRFPPALCSSGPLKASYNVGKLTTKIQHRWRARASNAACGMTHCRFISFRRHTANKTIDWIERGTWGFWALVLMGLNAGAKDVRLSPLGCGYNSNSKAHTSYPESSQCYLGTGAP